jgi:hypothetical protein
VTRIGLIISAFKNTVDSELWYEANVIIHIHLRFLIKFVSSLGLSISLDDIIQNLNQSPPGLG